MQPTRLYRFIPCLMLVYDHDKITDSFFFEDGSSVRMTASIPAQKPDYLYAVERAGYGDDWWKYAVEHDLAHHFLADALIRPTSITLWRAAHGITYIPGTIWPEDVADEERMVNSFQRFLNTGERDEYGVMDDLLRKLPGLPDSVPEAEANLDTIAGPSPP